MRNYVTFHKKFGNFLKHYKFRRCEKLHLMTIITIEKYSNGKVVKVMR